MVRKLDEAILALLKEGGALVGSAACSPMELAFARTEGRFFVDENGYGFVLRYRQWREHAERAIACLALVEAKVPDDTVEFVPMGVPDYGVKS